MCICILILVCKIYSPIACIPLAYKNFYFSYSAMFFAVDTWTTVKRSAFSWNLCRMLLTNQIFKNSSIVSKHVYEPFKHSPELLKPSEKSKIRWGVWKARPFFITWSCCPNQPRYLTLFKSLIRVIPLAL